MKPLLVIGSSGHASAVLEAIEAQAKYQVIGLLDSFEAPGTTKWGYQILGRAEDAAALAFNNGCNAFFIAVGDNWKRWQMSRKLAADLPQVEYPVILHPSVSASPTAEIGGGSVIMAAGVVTAHAAVGQGCIVYTASTVNHNCRMGDYSSISAGVHLGGGTAIGCRTSVGIGCTLRERLTVGDDTVIGAGSVVLNDVPDCSLVYGVPGRIVRSRAPDERYMR